MRITGSGQLDPDFSKIKRANKVLGSIAERDLHAPGSQKWLVPRINPVCENCGSREPHQVIMSYYPLLGGVIPFVKKNKQYHLVCGTCGESIELEYQEYLQIKPFMVR